MDSFFRNTNLTPLRGSDSAQRTQPSNGTNPDDLLLNMVSIIHPTTDVSDLSDVSDDPFQDMRNNYSYVDPIQLQNTMIASGSKLEQSDSLYYRDQGTYRKALAPVMASLMYAIQNNDAQGVYNALSKALELATGLQMKRGNAAGGDGAKIRGMEANIYKNILNDPNMVNLKNPQDAFQFMTQTIMWTQAGSLPDHMYNASQSVGASTFFMDPFAHFSSYNY